MNPQTMGLSGAMMAALGALLGLRAVGTRLAALAMQADSFRVGPTPRALGWIAGTAVAQRRLAAADAWLALGIAVLAALLAGRLLRLLNPRGTLIAPGTTAGARPWQQTPLEPALVRRAAFGAGLTLYLLGGAQALLFGDAPTPPGMWGLAGLSALWPARPWLGLAAAFLLGGALLWLLWG